MKTTLGLILCAVLSAMLGCASLPKDTYVRDGEMIVNTPWGPSSVKGAVLATGKAAIAAASEIEQATTVPQTAAEKLAAKSKK